MSKKISNLIKFLIAAALIAGGIFSAVIPGTAQAAGLASSQPATVSGTGDIAEVLAATGSLSASESASLIFMVEEEKLAHDVYLALYQKWGLQVFLNISNSEQTHMDAISRLITSYGLTSPVQPAPGKFTDPALQTLYNQLIARGSSSIAEALKVGGLIEEVDILDLQARIQETTHADIRQVYNNLMNGSFNHLRAFSNTLKTQTGETYQPQKLSLATFQDVVSGSQGGAGRQYGRGRRAGG